MTDPSHINVLSSAFLEFAAPFPGPGGKWQVSTAGGNRPRWRRDGRELFYMAPDNRLMVAAVDGQRRIDRSKEGELTANSPEILGLLGYRYGIAGMTREARDVLSELDDLTRQKRYVFFSTDDLYRPG